jgi:hypothetical protein
MRLPSARTARISVSSRTRALERHRGLHGLAHPLVHAEQVAGAPEAARAAAGQLLEALEDVEGKSAHPAGLGRGQCWRTQPELFPIAPEATKLVSTTITSRTPLATRWKAMLVRSPRLR